MKTAGSPAQGHLLGAVGVGELIAAAVFLFFFWGDVETAHLCLVGRRFHPERRKNVKKRKQTRQLVVCPAFPAHPPQPESSLRWRRSRDPCERGSGRVGRGGGDDAPAVEKYQPRRPRPPESRDLKGKNGWMGGGEGKTRIERHLRAFPFPGIFFCFFCDALWNVIMTTGTPPAIATRTFVNHSCCNLFFLFFFTF